jgi:hypothetical protein
MTIWSKERTTIKKNRMFLPGPFGMEGLSKPNNSVGPCTYVFTVGLYLSGSQQNDLLCSVLKLPACISDTVSECNTNQK